ncbi:MAG: hypothetical protein FWC86_05595, partial [Coriobacteriia bacterium]|nr:hypothetical protein [Coriobacteriia bacterium]
MKERLGNMLTNKRTVQASTKFKVTIVFVALFLLTLPLLTVASSESDSSANTIEATQEQASEQVQQIPFANPSYGDVVSSDVADTASLEESYAPAEEVNTYTPPLSLEDFEVSQEVLSAYQGIAPAAAGTAVAEIIKTLYTPRDEPAPDLNFTFLVERYAFLNADGHAGALTNLPPIGIMDGNTGAIELSINATNSAVTYSGTTRTLTRTLDLLEGITFTTPGTYIWRITEVEGSSGATGGRVRVAYSDAEYELRVVVTGTDASTVALVEIVEVIDGEATPVGTSLYSWGTNATGQLGHGNTAGVTIPTRVTWNNRDNWVHTASALGASTAISAEGHLYVWGAARNAAAMGRGGTVATNITVPERLTIATAASDNWIFTDVSGSSVFAINDAGELWAWG